MTMKRLLIACLCALTATALAQDLAFTNVKVFDGESMLEGEQTVLVQDGWIAAVGTDIEIPEGTETIDGAGATLMPGLIDSHVHTFYEQALQQNAVFGVTTVLDMFTDEGLATSMRQAQQDGGVTDRADMFSSGMLATAPGGHGTQFGVQVDTLTEAAEAEHWVDARIAAGADYIKVILETGEEMDFQVDTISDEILRAVIDASHVRGLIVVAHVQTLEAAKQAVAAGVDGLAHIFTDAVADEEFVAAAVDSGLFVIPTLTVFQSVGSEPIDESISGDPLLAPYLSSQDLQNLGMPFSGFEQLSLENGLESVRLLHEAGVPKGVFNLVNGDGEGVGTQLSVHPDVSMVSFTGSSRAGKLISKNAADTFKRVHLELGGKGANIIFADADEKAVKRGAAHCFNNTGQSCNAPTRMLVERSIYEKAVATAAEMAESTRVGSAHESGKHIGPLVSQTQFDKVQDLIQKGIDEGAKLVAGGLGRPEGLNRGYFVRPTVFADVSNDMTIAREEIFGPVLSIIPFESEDEAIAIANDTPYGLTNYVQSQDGAKRNRAARRLRAGMIEMNGTSRGRGSPFGGMKASGIGREGGIFGIEEFLEVKAVSGWDNDTD